MDLTEYKTKSLVLIYKLEWVAILCFIINSCVVDQMDCILIVNNQIQRDIFYGVSSRNDAFEKYQFIKAFNLNLKDSRVYPTRVKISASEYGSKKIIVLSQV